MSKRLVIAGAGGFGREVYQWARDINKLNQNWNEIVFIDDNTNSLDSFGLKDKLISNIAEYVPLETDVVICAIGDPTIRMKMYEILEKKNAKLCNIIHPTAIVGETCTLKNGIIICPNVCISANTTVGNYVMINMATTVGHDVVIEDGCTISCNCDIMGFSHLAKGVFLGSTSLILPKVRVGKCAKVGAGSVVIRNVKPEVTVFGNPAVVISRPN